MTHVHYKLRSPAFEQSGPANIKDSVIFKVGHMYFFEPRERSLPPGLRWVTGRQTIEDVSRVSAFGEHFQNLRFENHGPRPGMAYTYEARHWESVHEVPKPQAANIKDSVIFKVGTRPPTKTSAPGAARSTDQTGGK